MDKSASFVEHSGLIMLAPDCIVGQLLRYASTADRPDAGAHWHFEAADDRQFRWLMQAGLGPLLHYATRDQPERVPEAWREPLLSAELTTRMRHANLVDTAIEIIDICARAGISVTLLKGIVTSEQFYPAPHLRPMADIDVLVPRECCAVVESTLVSAGYRIKLDYPDEDDQHHGRPLHHPTRDVWVEIHRRLFPQDDDVCRSPAFSPTNIGANSLESAFHGLPALRLGTELQLLYIASSWMRDMTLSRIHASFLPSIFDAIFLLNDKGETLDWAKLLSWADDDIPTASLHVLLTYLASRASCAVPLPVCETLAKRQRLVGTIQLSVIHAMLERYLIGGRAWNHVLPFPVAGRYSLRRQWAKRIIGRSRPRTA